ncbi:PorT family protein [Marivirga sp. S37H4]|uniref:PorT family protein n=1 Tax=Marivirga aurantiaca TaxID=2802615 RepID=A0A934X025_9BACT|nr:porin family protein [Marivirga aurantiaca]MBK6265910.1 PorT family protein [Marivirga aurantiaca]
MKKLLLSAILIITFGSAQAQVKFGLKLAPTMTFNRVEGDSDTLSFSPDGIGVGMQLGPIMDFEFKENHYFSTGLIFATKRAGININDQNRNQEITEDYALHYLQVPVSLKLYTEEVGLDKKLYFQVGGTLDFKTKGKGDEENFVQKFNFMDLSALLAVGVEYGLGIDTKLFGGIIYQRGLFNIINESRTSEDWTVQNDLLGLEFGITF